MHLNSPSRSNPLPFLDDFEEREVLQKTHILVLKNAIMYNEFKYK